MDIIDEEADKIRVQELLDQQDPRVSASALIKIQAGGYALVNAARTMNLDKKTVSFALPSPAALCLSLSHTAYQKAQEVSDADLFQLLPHGWSAENTLPALFDLFEQLFLNVIFAYTALEAFVNEVIPDSYTFSQTRQDKKCTEQYDRDQIERNLSLDIKLSEILPEITGVKLPKGGSLWNEYLQLKQVRDRIIHIKTVDMGYLRAEQMKEKGSQEKDIWTDLLKRRKLDASVAAHKLIQHFPRIEEDPASSPVAGGRNRWILKFPFS